MLRGSLEVIEFAPRQAAPDEAPVTGHAELDDIWSRLRREHRTFTSCSAALAALAVHTLLVGPMLWAGGASLQHPPDRKYAGAAAMQWIVLDDSPVASGKALVSGDSPLMVAIGLSDILPTAPAVSVSPPARPRDDDAQAQDDSSLGVAYGRYVGQIHARIDRAWRRPRTEIGAPIFQCQVQVDQDGAGRVGDITLLQCNGDGRWRLSLVHAIEAASPLPAPPAAAVFTRHVLLQFRAMAFSPGAQAELYEPPAAATADTRTEADALQSESAFEALREAASARHSPKVVELRIEGSRVEVGPEHQ